MGAVAYDPKVVTIWDGFRRWLRHQGFAFDYVLYSNYERQVEELLAGRIHAAWNSPLAWIRADRLARASGGQVSGPWPCGTPTATSPRSVVVVRSDSPIAALADLHGRVVATGAVDSPQATLHPARPSASARARAAAVTSSVRRFDVGVGLHGDHIGGERDAARALVAGEVDAACMIDGNHLRSAGKAPLPAGSTRILAQTVRSTTAT